jgi:4a-hydroxytetrahydrobiopterin dehydratase
MFVNRIGDLPAAESRPPEILLTSSQVIVTLPNSDTGGVTASDIDLAREISVIAGDAGLHADTAQLIQVEFALDTAASDRVAPFYEALLDGVPAGIHSKGDLVDPSGQVNTLLWWQEPRNDGRFPPPESAVDQRWHLDVWVSHDEAVSRIQTAISAGGRLVPDAAAPSYWVLEDPDGNRACVCAPMVD